MWLARANFLKCQQWNKDVIFKRHFWLFKSMFYWKQGLGKCELSKKKSVWGKSHLENAVFRKDVTASCILDG